MSLNCKHAALLYNIITQTAKNITPYPVSKEVILEGPSRLQPYSLLWVLIGQEQTKFLSCTVKHFNSVKNTKSASQNNENIYNL